MATRQLRCDVYVVSHNGRTGENAVECGAIALACTECGESAGCEEHSIICPRCGKPVCSYCADDHSCRTPKRSARAA